MEEMIFVVLTMESDKYGIKTALVPVAEWEEDDDIPSYFPPSRDPETTYNNLGFAEVSGNWKVMANLESVFISD